MATRSATVPTVPMRRCRACGCTDLHACEGGCSWVDHDLCSACVLPKGARVLVDVGWSPSLASAWGRAWEPLGAPRIWVVGEILRFVPNGVRPAGYNVRVRPPGRSRAQTFYVRLAEVNPRDDLAFKAADLLVSLEVATGRGQIKVPKAVADHYNALRAAVDRFARSAGLEYF